MLRINLGGTSPFTVRSLCKIPRKASQFGLDYKLFLTEQEVNKPSIKAFFLFSRSLELGRPTPRLTSFEQDLFLIIIYFCSHFLYRPVAPKDLKSPPGAPAVRPCVPTLKTTPAKRDVLVVAQLCQFAGDGASRCILRGGLPPKSSNFPQGAARARPLVRRRTGISSPHTRGPPLRALR